MFFHHPVADLLALVDGLRDHWGPHEENTALLLEQQAYALELSWADRIVDPNDRDLARERAARKRAGITPPRHPLIPPIAHRPPLLAQQRIADYTAAVTRHSLPEQPASLDDWKSTVGVI